MNVQGRDFSLDFIRFLAICFVVFLHSMGAISNAMGEGKIDTITVMVAGGLNTIIHNGVPLFVILSGYLLLGSGKEESIRTFFKKRIKRLLVPFLFWSVAMYLLIYEGGNKSFVDFVFKVGTDGVHGVYWYIYMLLGLYAMTPVLRVLVGNSSLSLIAYLTSLLFMVWCVGTYFPSIRSFGRNLSENTVYLFYFLVGCLICKFKDHRHFRLISLCGFFSFWLLCVMNRILQFTSFSFNVLVSVFLFASLLTIDYSKLNGKVKSVIQWVSISSYGIYLNHILFIAGVEDIGGGKYKPLMD